MRTAPDRRYALRDRLAELRQAVRTMYRGGGTITPRDAETLQAELTRAIGEADALYAELSAKRWNERAQADPLAEAVMAEAARPGGNLRLFPVCGRPLPGDALQLRPTHDPEDDCA